MKSLIALWQNDPEVYFRDVLGVKKLWDGQKAMLRSIPIAIREHKNIIVPSGHSLGKDYICGGLALYFLHAWGPCIVVTTAPTDRQVKAVMWGEIKTHHGNAKIEIPGGDPLVNRIEIKPNWYAIGFTTKETGAMVGKFQGFHSPRVFVIASEAQAIHDQIYEQIDAILTGEIGLLIEIGNPLRASGRFARDIKNKQDNIVIHLSCLDTPNYKQRKQVIPGVCNYHWVEKKRKEWGEDDPRWAGRVLGQVPKTSIDSVFSAEIVDKMVNKLTRSTQVRRGIGVDVARFGDDETVIYGGTNGVVEAQDIYTGLSTTATAARSVMVNTKIRGGNFIAVDGDGLGGGTIDALNDMDLPGMDIVELHGSGKVKDSQYANARAEWWMTAARRAEEGEASIPDDEILKEELLEVKFFVNKQGKIQVESKEDIKERLGRSPNRADAWVYFQWGCEQADPMEKDKWKDETWDRAGGSSGVSVSGKVGAMGR